MTGADVGLFLLGSAGPLLLLMGVAFARGKNLTVGSEIICTCLAIGAGIALVVRAMGGLQ